MNLFFAFIFGYDLRLCCKDSPIIRSSITPTSCAIFTRESRSILSTLDIGDCSCFELTHSDTRTAALIGLNLLKCRKEIKTSEQLKGKAIFFISSNINARPSADINQLPLFELTRNKNVSKELQLLCVQWPKFFRI